MQSRKSLEGGAPVYSYLTLALVTGSVPALAPCCSKLLLSSDSQECQVLLGGLALCEFWVLSFLVAVCLLISSRGKTGP